jgi:hypothetical protein
MLKCNSDLKGYCVILQNLFIYKKKVIEPEINNLWKQ